MADLGREMPRKSLENTVIRRARKLLEVCQKDSGALKKFSLAKAEIILASVRIISARD